MKNLYPDFVDYVFSFYGKNGIYDMGATKDQILKATYIRLKSLKYAHMPFDQDTVDREYVRDILIGKFNLIFPQGVHFE
tara:strand:+ start:1826 stop:2062 length:237 start_codon:yes stop_codon:yes gene_type:complete